MSGGGGGKPPKIQSQEDRDLKEMKKRAKSHPQIEDDPEATPVEVFPSEEVTHPIELIQRESGRYERDRSYREEMDAIKREYERNPAYRALWNMWRRQRRESNRTLGALGSSQLENHEETKKLASIAEELGSISEWKHEVDVVLRITKWILGLMIAATLGSIIVIATKIYGWGMSNGEIEIRIQHLEQEMEHKQPSLQEIIEKLKKGNTP